MGHATLCLPMGLDSPLASGDSDAATPLSMPFLKMLLPWAEPPV